MKTPEEIKHALECCASVGACIIDRCEYYLGGNLMCTRELTRDALEYINELEAKAPRWISVKERLPEEGVWVLTRDIYGKIRNSSLYVLRDGTNMFWPNRLFPGKHITHWMPILEVPEEG